ncbi:MAG: hypothetical protein ISR77_31790 [Pirellulaceae bacterium]|nr:hypothetical protein [Pirellulaceae bacterium]
MKRTLTPCGILSFLITCWLVPCGIAADAKPDEPTLTFFGWSDQHVQTDGDAKHLLPAIDAMNALPGTPYPDSIGGKVAEPAFVFGCGDLTEWPTHAATKAYDQLITERLKFPAYDILGNHDEGGKVPSETMRKWLVSRHGAPSYTFCRGGVHFIALFSKYDESLGNPAQPLTDEALDFLRSSLAKLPERTPLVVAAHLCFDAITNRDSLCQAIGDANVIAILGGHYHKAKVDQYRGCNFVQLPSPAPGSPSEFTVVRITSNRLVAIPYDYRKKQWIDDPKKQLDARIRELRFAEPECD